MIKYTVEIKSREAKTNRVVVIEINNKFHHFIRRRLDKSKNVVYYLKG